jgi:hypothetical protein
VPRPGFAAQSNDVFSKEKMFDVFPQSVPQPRGINHWIDGLMDKWIVDHGYSPTNIPEIHSSINPVKKGKKHEQTGNQMSPRRI